MTPEHGTGRFGPVRPLGPDDLDEVWRQSQLAFGYRSDEPPSSPAGWYGIDSAGGGLRAFARVRSYEQSWGGRPVPMAGIASVVVPPAARGSGAAADLMRGLLPVLRAAGQPVSVLFPTGVGVYRPVGWEVVGSLDDTRIATRDLAPRARPEQVRVRTATEADAAAVAGLYRGLAEDGLLVRAGPEFPAEPAAGLRADVVALAEADDGSVVGYTSYDRGSGYRDGSELRVWDFVSASGPGSAALLSSLASWSTVAATTLWRGPTRELALQLRRAVPPPVTRQPWMLRIVDAPAAVAQRGFRRGVTVEAAFELRDRDVPQHEGGWRLQVADGTGALAPMLPTDRGSRGAEPLPVLDVRGLGLLFAGAAGTGGLLRAGLLDRELPELDAAFGRSTPVLLDYF